MSQKSSKAQQGAVTSIQIKFDGGLNYSRSPSQISDNELTRALNVIYDSQSGTPETRPGTLCVTAAALAHPIQKIYYYEKSSSLKWLVCASYGNLYYLNGTAWTLIGALTDVTTVPTFITFNTFMLVADGGTNLKKWDGTTLTSLADGLHANAIAEIGGRVVINSTADTDLVTFSGLEDETMWDTADLTNPAIGLRAGFGDNMDVNGFAVFSDDLLISKTGSAIKKIYRINTVGVPTAWTVSELTTNNASQSAHTIVSAFNNVFFVDSNGFKSIKGVTEYGDLQIDTLGEKINSAISQQICVEAVYIPTYTSVWISMMDTIYCYSRLVDGAGNMKHVFTELQFAQGRINSLLQAGTVIYLAGANGYLYKLDATATTDQTTPLVYAGIPTLITSKQFNFFGGAILRRCLLAMKAAEMVGTPLAYLKVNTADQTGTIIKTITLLSAQQELYSATGDLATATILLADMAEAAWTETSTNRVRGTSLQFQIDSQSGRFGIEGLQAELALVGS